MHRNTRSSHTRRISTSTRFTFVLMGLGATGTACQEKKLEDQQVSKSSLVAATKSLPANATGSERTLYRKSAACYECAKAHCGAGLDRCQSIEGVAANGPAKGKARAELCRSTLECVLSTACATERASIKCYCGKANGADCATGDADGVCKAAIEAGLETTSGTEVAVRFVDDVTGGGTALGLVHCLIDNACKACF